MTDVEKETQSYLHTQEAIKRHDVPIERPETGAEYTLGDARFVIVSSVKAGEENSNNTSVGVKLVHGENSFLFCGDAESDAEEAMLSNEINLECDVLKVSHHGSRTATEDAFLAAADPTWAVISCGADNQYGMPHAEVLEKLDGDDVQVYRTDTMGTVTAVSDGKEISWMSEKKTAELSKTIAETSSEAAAYILNTNTKKIHRPECSSTAEIAGHNRQDYNGIKEDMEAEGYSSCKKCNP